MCKLINAPNQVRQGVQGMNRVRTKCQGPRKTKNHKEIQSLDDGKCEMILSMSGHETREAFCCWIARCKQCKQYRKYGRCCARQVCEKDEQTEDDREQRKNEKKVFESGRGQKRAWWHKREEKSGMKAERKHSHWFNLLLFIRNVSFCKIWMPFTCVRTYKLFSLPGWSCLPELCHQRHLQDPIKQP